MDQAAVGSVLIVDVVDPTRSRISLGEEVELVKEIFGVVVLQLVASRLNQGDYEANGQKERQTKHLHRR